MIEIWFSDDQFGFCWTTQIGSKIELQFYSFIWKQLLILRLQKFLSESSLEFH
jgi:hypothetical protein